MVSVQRLPEQRPGPLECHAGCSRRCAFDRPAITEAQAGLLVRLQAALSSAQYIPDQVAREAASEKIGASKADVIREIEGDGFCES